MEEEETYEDEELNEEDELRHKLQAVGVQNLYGDDKNKKNSKATPDAHQKDD